MRASSKTMTLLLLSCALAACYAPNPPSGSYLCTSNDAGTGGACPTGLSCVYGQCVKQASDAVFKFTITADQAKPGAGRNTEPMLSVNEHEPFPITITAQDNGGNTVTTFGGAVSLSSTWGDVRVCASATSCPSSGPTTLALVSGVGKGYISLNRETSPPQSAILRVSFASAVGTSGKLALTVTSPVFTPDANPIVASIEQTANHFGFAELAAGAPYVIQTNGSYNMFFLGVIGSLLKPLTAVGVATSTDGKTFTPPTAPIVQSADETKPNTIGAPAAIVDSNGFELYYPKDGSTSTNSGYQTVQLQTASTQAGLSTAMPAPVIDLTATPSDCPYCTALDTPALLSDPTPALNGGTANAKIMYFSALSPNASSTSGGNVLSVVRAYAADGKSFAVDPSALIKANSDEIFIYAPRVLVDGSVYKMWYTYAALADLTGLNVPTPCADTFFRVGYATSNDGYFWVRSPRNLGGGKVPNPAASAPAMNVATTGWAAGKSVLVGSVLPQDGADPASGVTLYYSVFDKAMGLGGVCVPNGIGRAVAVWSM
jgi:hypothetical protein